MGKLSRITWPHEYYELQRIEQLLLCGICYDYMDTSVMTPCSHNYCSLCIRKYLHYKTQCPACFEKTFEKDLRTNRILDELISYFGKIRSKLVDCVAGAKIEVAQDEENIDENCQRLTPVRPARMNQSEKKTPVKMEVKRNQALLEHDATPEKVLLSPSTSGVSKIATIFTPKSKKNITSRKILPCPVCKVELPQVNINKHLDDCLKRETSSSHESARIESKRKPLPKLVFSLMKDTELRKKIKELGLPTQGDRKTLEARFQRYSTLYNAECDKREPRSVEQLLRQCDEEEALEKKMLKLSQSSNRLKVNRNTEQNAIEEAQKKYLESNKKNYQSLIATIKEREKSRKPSLGHFLIDQDVDGPSGESSEKHILENNVNHSEDEDLDRTCYPINANDANFHDSDSDTSCPLQHYTSDDPMSFVSIQMSSSDNSNKKNSLDTSVSPARNATIGNVNDAPINPTNQVDDIFNVTTDAEDVPTSEHAKATKIHLTKRAKLSPRNTPNTDNARQVNTNENKLEGKKLAQSIARDFTFDTSSNESLGSQATHETVHTKSTEKPKVEADKNVEDIKLDLPNVDKENEALCATSSSTTSVSRPLRKRHCVTRAQSSRDNGTKDTGISVDEQALRSTSVQRENVRRVESPVKRRTRRKIETPAATNNPNKPPSRPLRKRNSVIKDSVIQQST